MTSIAIIPARGGSKRIPLKNIRLFHGLPIIVYSIRAALASGLFERVVVSTDNEEIASIARAHGAQTPFIRPVALSDDYTGTLEVTQHALSTLPEQPEFVCCIYATAPFLQAHFLKQGLQSLMDRPDKSYAFSVTTFNFPIQRALHLTSEGDLQAMHPEYRMTRSQDLPETLHDAGQFYWGRRAAWLRGDTLFSPVSLPVMLPRYLVQDIDTLEDWRRAEIMHMALRTTGELQP